MISLSIKIDFRITISKPWKVQSPAPMVKVRHPDGFTFTLYNGPAPGREIKTNDEFRKNYPPFGDINALLVWKYFL